MHAVTLRASALFQPSMPMAPQDRANAAPPRCLRVLVAEDDVVSRLRMTRTIERLGHDVLVASDGLEAWELFAERGADVIVTDWLMPGLDGRELCQRVRAHPNTPYTYIIFTTVLEGQDHVRDALSAGADDYLLKPTLAEDIEARLIVAERVSALHRDRAHAVAHRDTLLQVARHLATEADPERILSAAVAQAMRLLDADAAVLYRWDETDHILSAVQSTLWNSSRSLLAEPGQGAAGRAVVERRPVRVADYALEDPSSTLFLDAAIRVALAVPLLHEGQLLGALEVGCRGTERTFPPHDSETLELLAANMSSTFAALEQRRALLTRADTDELTGLANRRRATDVLKRYITMARRRGDPVALALVDLDHFKEISAAHGLAAGDAVLQGVGRLLAQSVRGENLLARWGGDEFVLGLYDTSQTSAMQQLADMLVKVRDETFGFSDDTRFSITFSAGVAEFPADGDDLLELYVAADAALSAAKVAGRNCILGTR